MTPQLIHAGWILDGAGAPAVPRASVLVDDGLIVAAGSSVDLGLHPRAAEAEVVDAGDATLLPGLIDGHVHLGQGLGEDEVWRHAERDRDTLLGWTLASAQAALCAGVTTLRDCGAPVGVSLSVKRQLNLGLHTGPRLLACGPAITTTAGHGAFLGVTADSEMELRLRVREAVRDGADFIKLMATGGRIDPEPTSNRRRAQYTVDELRAAVDDAHRLQRSVVAHANATEGIRDAVLAGVDVIAHCNWLAAEEGRIDYDTGVAEEMVRRGVFVDLNVEGGWRSLDAADGSAEVWATEHPENRWQLMEDMRRRGIPIFFTSDAFGPLVAEFPALLVRASQVFGIPIHEVIWRASGLAAQAIGLGSQVGTITVGKRADLLLVEGSVADDATALLRVRSVWRDGIRVVHGGALAPGRAVERLTTSGLALDKGSKTNNPGSR
jgi:imidazolonepropionase-like amidohydrolase